MPGDPTSRDDDDLLSQIDELKARMDRLMRGGSSTSNSALLTEEVKARQAESEDVRPAVPQDPAPDRTRVRDLIGPEDTEVVEGYLGPKEVVPFPEDQSSSPRIEPTLVATTDPEPQPVPRPEPARPVGGSVIPVERDVYEPRPSVTTFDELGSAIQQELARDSSVPPVGSKRGPDLASRFGPAVEQPAADEPAADEPAADEPAADEPAADEPVADEPAALALPEDEELPSEEQAAVNEPEIEDQDEAEYVEDEEGEVRSRSNVGAVAAIWVVAAIASGAIATLHFTGLI